MTDEEQALIGDLTDIEAQLKIEDNHRDFDPIERLQMVIMDLSDERPKTTDGYPVNRYSSVYSYSKHSRDGIPSVGRVRFQNGEYCSFFGATEPFFHKRENVIEHIRSLGQVPADDRKNPKAMA